MNASEQIDNRITELESWRAEMLSYLRRLILETDPALKEEWKWKNPAWSLNGLVFGLVAETSKNPILQLTFFQGAALKDPARLFNAGDNTKAMRYIKINEAYKPDEQALRQLLHEAVAYNKTNP